MNWLLGNPAPIAVELPHNPAAQPGANAANSNRQQRGTVGDAPPRAVNSGTMSVYVCLLSHPRSSEMLTAEKQGKEAATEPKLYHILHYYLPVQTNIHLPSEMFLAEGKSALHLASGWQLLCSFTITSPAALIVGNRNFPQTYVGYVTVVCCYAMLCYAAVKKKLVLLISSNQLTESRAFKFPNKPGIDSKSKVQESAWAPKNKHHFGSAERKGHLTRGPLFCQAGAPPTAGAHVVHGPPFVYQTLPVRHERRASDWWAGSPMRSQVDLSSTM